MEEAEELAAVEAWFARWRGRLDFQSDDQGCDCCVHTCDVDAPPEAIADRAASLPESAHGVTNVVLVLSGGRRVGPVRLVWAREIVRVGSRSIADGAALPFDVRDVVDLLPARRGRPR